MPQSLSALHVHLIFATKHRRPLLDDSIRPRAHAYLARTLQTLECGDITIGGVADHVHALLRLTRKHAPADVIQILKKESSKFVKTLAADLSTFHWQDGYGLFSVSHGQLEIVRSYVQSQEEHHRQETFEDELRRILRSHAVVYDERYLWD